MACACLYVSPLVLNIQSRPLALMKYWIDGVIYSPRRVFERSTFRSDIEIRRCFAWERRLFDALQCQLFTCLITDQIIFSGLSFFVWEILMNFQIRKTMSFWCVSSSFLAVEIVWVGPFHNIEFFPVSTYIFLIVLFQHYCGKNDETTATNYMDYIKM